MEAVEAAGATFVGPPTHAVEKMGDKVESKKIAAAAKVGEQRGRCGVCDQLRGLFEGEYSGVPSCPHSSPLTHSRRSTQSRDGRE